MIPQPCALERFFARYEFSVEHVACASDVDGLPMSDLLAWADEESRDAWQRLTLGYTETTGRPELRAEIAGLYETVAPDEVVVCGGGAAEALYLLFHALLDRGDGAAVVWPAFEALTKVAPAIGAELTLVRLDPGAGWRLDVDEVRRALRPATRLLAVNFPHNPTGVTLDPATLAALVELTTERGVTLLSDEVYRLLEFDEASRLPAAVDLDSRAVSVGVMSKAFGLAGLRIGWIAIRDAQLRSRILTLKDYTSVCASAPSEVLATAALRARHRLVARCRDIVTTNLRHVEAFVDSTDLVEWTRPTGGTVGFPRLAAPWPIEEFVEELVAKHGVLLLPGTVFDDTTNRFRIGLGRRTLPQALDRIADFITATPRSRRS